jgi:hypothetical protein
MAHRRDIVDEDRTASRRALPGVRAATSGMHTWVANTQGGKIVYDYVWRTGCGWPSSKQGHDMRNTTRFTVYVRRTVGVVSDSAGWGHG